MWNLKERNLGFPYFLHDCLDMRIAKQKVSHFILYSFLFHQIYILLKIYIYWIVT